MAPRLHAISRMHFGAAVRQVLSVACGDDLRHAKAHTVVAALRSPQTLRLLAANVEAAFGVRVPDEDLARLKTVRDVLQCVRLRRWVTRVEADMRARTPFAATEADPDAPIAADVSADADAPTPTTIAARAVDPRQQTFRFTRRRHVTPAAPLVDRPPATRGPKRP